MPRFRLGNMWTAYEPADLFLITTNSTIRRDGTLVMGRGIARQARERFPGLAAVLGRQVLSCCGNQGEYGLLVSPSRCTKTIQPALAGGKAGCVPGEAPLRAAGQPGTYLA